MNRRSFLLAGTLGPITGLVAQRLGFLTSLKGIGPQPGDSYIHTFDNFVVGPENVFAIDAVKSTLIDIHFLNPLFIQSPCGAGKTHLMKALQHEVRNTNREFKVRHVTAERFMNDIRDAIRHQKLENFRHHWRLETDLWIIDDIHVIAQCDTSQDELQSIFDAMEKLGKQMIFTSDLLPKEMIGLNEGLRSRLSSGHTVRIGSPNIISRIDILDVKVKEEGLSLSNDLLIFVAGLPGTTGVRQMQRSLMTLKMHSDLRKVPITMGLAREVLS